MHQLVYCAICPPDLFCPHFAVFKHDKNHAEEGWWHRHYIHLQHPKGDSEHLQHGCWLRNIPRQALLRFLWLWCPHCCDSLEHDGDSWHAHRWNKSCPLALDIVLAQVLPHWLSSNFYCWQAWSEARPKDFLKVCPSHGLCNCWARTLCCEFVFLCVLTSMFTTLWHYF